MLIWMHKFLWCFCLNFLTILNQTITMIFYTISNDYTGFLLDDGTTSYNNLFITSYKSTLFLHFFYVCVYVDTYKLYIHNTLMSLCHFSLHVSSLLWHRWKRQFGMNNIHMSFVSYTNKWLVIITCQWDVWTKKIKKILRKSFCWNWENIDEEALHNITRDDLPPTVHAWVQEERSWLHSKCAPFVQ